MSNLHSVDWSEIPAPQDDGAARHLSGRALPAVTLTATNGASVDLSKLKGRCVIYVYPRTGEPGVPLPDGWDQLPGARGCTPQSCAFRDHFAELKALGVAHLIGLSSQTTPYQQEVVRRLHLPFPLLSDDAFLLTEALNLPSFQTSGMRLLKRLTMIIADGRIDHVFYPVFPPDQNARDVIDWLAARV